MAVTSGGGWVATGGESPVKSTTAEAPPRRRRGVRVVDIVVKGRLVGSPRGVVTGLPQSLKSRQRRIRAAVPTSSARRPMRSVPARPQDIHASNSAVAPVVAYFVLTFTQDARFLLRVVHVSAPFGMVGCWHLIHREARCGRLCGGTGSVGTLPS